MDPIVNIWMNFERTYNRVFIFSDVYIYCRGIKGAALASIEQDIEILVFSLIAI